MIVVRCKNCLGLNRVPLNRIESKPHCGQCKTALDVPHAPSYATPANIDREIAYWPETLLLVFTSTANLYCKIYDALAHDLAAERIGKLKVMMIDVDAEPYLAERYKVTTTPSFIVFRNGTMAIRLDGAPKDKNDFIKWVDNLMNYNSY